MQHPYPKLGTGVVEESGRRATCSCGKAQKPCGSLHRNLRLLRLVRLEHDDSNKDLLTRVTVEEFAPSQELAKKGEFGVQGTVPGPDQWKTDLCQAVVVSRDVDLLDNAKHRGSLRAEAFSGSLSSHGREKKPERGS